MKYDYNPTSFLGKCGNDCGSCPLHKNNLLTMEDRIKTAQGCYKYINWNPTPEKLKACWGCQSEKGFIYLPKCKNRMCAYHNNVKNCAYCSEFPCEDSPKLNIERIEKKLGRSIPQEEYNLYVGPWTSTAILQQIRQNLSKDEIVQMKPYSVNLGIVEFPANLKYSKDEIDSYISLHQIISIIEPLSNLSFARVKVRKEIRKYLLKLLFTFGLHGEIIKNEDQDKLILTSENYFKEMTTTRYYSFGDIVQQRFDQLKENGINIELKPEKSLEDVYTKMKGLRKTGWRLEMTFSYKIGGNTGLKTLSNYVLLLISKNERSAYRNFAKGDMRILGSD